MRISFKTIVLLLLSVSMVYAAGSWSPNHWSYKPQLTTQGTTDYTQFNISQDQIDAKLASTKVFGDPGFTTLAEAITTIGSTNTKLVIPSSAVAIAVPAGVTTTIPANVQLQVDKGAYFIVPPSSTLAINGPIEAGPYQIFSWAGTGAVDVSVSPTTEVPTLWFGSKIGTGYDNVAILNMMNNALGKHQWMTFPPGITRIASNQVFSATNENGYGIKGSGMFASYLYIDVGATNDGVTFIAKTGTDCYGFRVKDLAFVGPTNCCKSGVVLRRSHFMKFENVAAYMGSTSYAFNLNGSVYGQMDRINIGQAGDVFDALGCVRPQHGLGFTANADGFGNNVWNINSLVVSAMGPTAPHDYTGYGIYMENAQGVAIIGGSLEACLNPLYIYNDGSSSIYNVQDIYIGTKYAYDLNINGIYALGADKITIDTGGFQVSNTYYPNGVGSIFKNCHSLVIRNSRFDQLNIGADCRDTHLDGIGVSKANGFVNQAPDTVFEGPVYSLSGPYNPFPSPGHDGRNIITTGFTRWPASGPPDGWSEGTGTWTKEASIIHTSTNSAKAVTGTNILYPALTLTADQLQQVKGQYVNFSMWIQVPSGTFSTYPALYIYPTVPDWTASTAYKVGDTVMPSAAWISAYNTANPSDHWPGGIMFKCITAGTSAASGHEPDWPRTGDYTYAPSDNGISWLSLSVGNSSNSTTPFSAADAGVWKQASVGQYIGWNVTSVQVAAQLYPKTGPVTATYYLAEPALMKGGLGPKGVVPGYQEFTDLMFLNGMAIGSDSYPPDNSSSKYHSGFTFKYGDRCWNNGAVTALTTGNASVWGCTVAGAPGTWAVLDKVH